MKRKHASISTVVDRPEANEQSDKSKRNAPDPGRQQGQTVEQPGRALAHAQVAHDMGQDQGIEHGVESIEHPAQ
jgi:hypothetical protein